MSSLGVLHVDSVSVYAVTFCSVFAVAAGYHITLNFCYVCVGDLDLMGHEVHILTANFHYQTDLQSEQL